jgi:hypothetical protein
VPPGEFVDNAGFAFDAEGKRLAFTAHEHATLWHLESGRLLRMWKLPPALGDRISFHGSDRLMLFRTETKDGVPPFSNNRPKDHPRVYRLYNLLGSTPAAPIREIDDHNLGCFGAIIPADGRFVVTDGIGGAPDRPARTFNAYNGLTGERLWSMSSHLKWNAWDGPLFDLDPSGTILILNNLENPTTWLSLPGREWIGEFPRSLHLSSGGTRWMEHYSNPKDAIFEWRYHPQGREGPAVPFIQDGYMEGSLVFTPDSRHVAWGSPDHTVTVCDLVEVQEAMAAHGLGW